MGLSVCWFSTSWVSKKTSSRCWILKHPVLGVKYFERHRSWHPDNAVHISQLRFLVSQGSEASAKEYWFNTTLIHKKIEESLTCVLVDFVFLSFSGLLKFILGFSLRCLRTSGKCQDTNRVFQVINRRMHRSQPKCSTQQVLLTRKYDAQW